MSDKLFVIDNDYGVKVYDPETFDYLDYIVVDETLTNAPISIATDAKGSFYITTDTWEVWKFAEDYTYTAKLTDAQLNPGNLLVDMFGLAVGASHVVVPYKRDSDKQLVLVITDLDLSADSRVEVEIGIADASVLYPAICCSGGKIYVAVTHTVVDSGHTNIVTTVLRLNEDGTGLETLFSETNVLDWDSNRPESFSYPRSLSVIDEKIYLGCGMSSLWSNPIETMAPYIETIRAGFNLKITQFGPTSSTRALCFDVFYTKALAHFAVCVYTQPAK